MFCDYAAHIGMEFFNLLLQMWSKMRIFFKPIVCLFAYLFIKSIFLSVRSL